MVINFEGTLRAHEIWISVIMVGVTDMFARKGKTDQLRHVRVLACIWVDFVAERPCCNVLLVEDVRLGRELVVTLSLALVQERVIVNHLWIMREFSHGVEMSISILGFS